MKTNLAPAHTLAYVIFNSQTKYMIEVRRVITGWGGATDWKGEIRRQTNLSSGKLDPWRDSRKTPQPMALKKKCLAITFPCVCCWVFACLLWEGGTGGLLTVQRKDASVTVVGSPVFR